MRLIKENLSRDLLKRGYEGSHYLSGHCYVASESLYHLTGKTLKPKYLRHEGVSHWYLTDGNLIIDLTAEQFQTTPDYSAGIGKGFLTKGPSKRSKILMERVNASLLWN